MYEVHLAEVVENSLKKLEQQIQERIKKRLKRLAEIPIPNDAKFITRDESNEKIFRYSIGDYRALYKVKEKENIVLIIKVDKRPRVYER